MTSKLTQNLHTRKTACKTWVLLTNICCARETEFFSKKQNEPMSMWGFETCIHEKWIPKSVFFLYMWCARGKRLYFGKKKAKKTARSYAYTQNDVNFFGILLYISFAFARENDFNFLFSKTKMKNQPLVSQARVGNLHTRKVTTK